MNGKSKCKILKEIRREIARQNDIELVTSECKFKGECSGTCPKCEAELRYLENELKKRRSLGKSVAVAGLAAAVMATSTSCSVDNISDLSPISLVESLFRGGELAGEPTIAGDVAYVPPIDISSVIYMTDDEASDQLYGFTRYDVMDIWEQYLTEQADTYDIFVFEDKEIKVTYDENGIVEKVEIK